MTQIPHSTQKGRAMSRLCLALVVAVAALVAVNPLTAATPKLAGTVGPGFTITLKKGTAKVTKLKAGKYAITVSDKSSIHNFRIKGPGLNRELTGVGYTGTKTVTVTLKTGTYRYVCDPHAAVMKGSFKVS
jgi:plastocyanin